MKRTRRVLALVLAVMMVAAFAPQTSFAAKAAKSVKIYVTVSDQGDFAAAKNKSPMLNKVVTVVDRNKDGQLTCDEAVYAAHKAYNSVSGFGITKTGWVTKVWGKEGSFAFLVNGQMDMTNTIDQQVINKGDMLMIGSYADIESFTDTFGYFNKYEATVTANQKLDLYYSYKIYDWNTGETEDYAEDGESMAFGIWHDGQFDLIEDATVGENGEVDFTFDKAGTYYILATGFAGDAYPVFANGCKVTVTPADDIKINVTVSNKGTVAKAKDGKAMFNRPVTVKDLDKNGIMTVDEALVAAHKKYSPKTSKGYARVEGSYGLSVTKLWSVNTSNTLFFVNNAALSTGVGSATIEDGDSLVASVNADDTYYSDWYAFMDKSSEATYIGKDVKLNISGHMGMAYTPEDMADNGIANLQLGLWSKGKVKPITDAVTDEEGNVTVSFNKSGTYYVTAIGSVKSQVMDCPIIAPMCVVKVKSIKSDITKAKPVLGVISVEENGIRLEWNDIAPEIGDGYALYRSTKKKSGYKKIAEVTGCEYLDTTAKKNKTYYYKVCKFAKENKKTYSSKFSNVLSIYNFDENTTK
ncbi:MAG: hypothetical protein PUB09_06835 [Firmicutes bacterium]|nr:hypothetical protein [Bacillota bacterium]